MPKTKISKIYLDMDGVLCDFEKRYTEIFDISPKQTRDNKEFNGFFDRFVADGEFKNLKMMPGVHDALAYINNLPVSVEILSSTASPKRHEAIKPQKEYWLQKHNIAYKSNFVPGKQNKYKFATPDSIIIDDTESVITDWNKAGGIGILHKDWNTTLAILSMYIDKA